MSCEIQILSHACLLVKTKKSSLVIDPWLVGSCYWRSWWNFPKPVYAKSDLDAVDAVVISHVHWDHWHGPTLKKFFKGKTVITADDPNLRSEKDLKSVGFNNIKRLSHSKSLYIGDIKVTFYNFGLFLTDSAIVIEAGGVTILNANDAKIAGAPLKHILSKHNAIDIALRSHSSANNRVCYEIPQDLSYINDDREHYFRSFKLFMDAVQPKFAVPFASNHCHLNEDVIKFNDYISNPIELRKYLDIYRDQIDWNLKVMLPGSKWNIATGFNCVDETPFSDTQNYIQKYLEEVNERIAVSRNRELRLKITNKVIDQFSLILRNTGAINTKLKIRFLITKPDNSAECFVVADNQINRCEDISLEVKKGVAIVLMPNIVFRDSILKNMFHHAGISKRCRYLAYDTYDMGELKKFVGKLERYELTGDINYNYIFRLISSYSGRWRELLVYLEALYLLKIKRKELYQIEEEILKQ
jgi:UDP-MurNAc hydroxylase